MNRNTNNSILTGVLAVCLLASVIFCLQFVFQTRELRKLSADVNSLNMARSRIQMISSACMEYAKTNSTLDSVLEGVGLNPKKMRAEIAAAKAAGK